ncbi:MAG: aminopeptidase P family protein [Alistipes senegalensis]|nr:aminopeptidase P family protein [Oxalobacter formigenes]MCM1280445.1 aminopeptidase P family protein [Alistipes senegalensis]
MTKEEKIKMDKKEEITGRIGCLRQVMEKADIAACLVPSSDPHLSEYLPPRWQGRQWLSGFDGSAGILLVTQYFAGLWTDSRYWVQAEKQLEGTGIELMKIQPGNLMPYAGWLAENLSPGQIVAADGQLFSLAAGRCLKEKLAAASLLWQEEGDLLDRIWENRPAVPAVPVYAHAAEMTGFSRREKLQMIREKLADAGANAHFMLALDDIAWTLNLRGGDIAFNPLFISCLLVEASQATLFVSPEKIPADIRQSLEADGVRLKPYEAAKAELEALGEETVLLIDPRRFTWGMFAAVGKKARIVEAASPAMLLKSRKTETEISHVRRTMERDGAALCEFFAWLEAALERGEKVSELDVADRLKACREKIPGYVSLSFDTIAGFNENGALPHYQATPEDFAVIDGSGLLLIDSGGQYPGGTTDITRVVPIGEVLPEQKRDYTLVLKGLIALSGAVFPRGIRAAMLDAIARVPLWKEGLDYGHGTGHGVGYFLNVHEGPQSISCYGAADPHTAMEKGMITSVEPGLYRTGKWGIRLENLVVNQEAQQTEFGEYLRFETLTLCPFEAKCMDLALLTPAEIIWINRYHAEVRQRLLPLLSEGARNWMIARTEALPCQV